jgi:integrase
MSLLIALGCFWGLRISDLTALKWEQILNVEEITIIEKKTNKKRVISINPQLKQHILDCHQKINPIGFQYVFVSQKKSVYTTQRINVMLKEIKATYKLNIKNFSSHSLRKTFGRQVFNMSGENSEMALIKLMEIFNHSNMGITKRYLGLKDEEIKEAYDLLKF